MYAKKEREKAMGKKKTIARIETAKLTIGEAFTKFISEKSALLYSESTIRNYKQSVKYFIDYLEASFYEMDEESPIAEVNKEQILDYTFWLTCEKNKNTINHYLRDLRAFLYWCMDDTREYIPHRFKIQQVKAQEETLKVYTDEELDKLLKKPAASDSFFEWRNWAIVNWVMATGNRGATICEVKLEDIDWETKHIFLRHTKNKRFQNILMSKELEMALKEYLKLWKITDNLFPDSSNDVLTTNALRHSFAKYCARRGVERTDLHGLRHTFARLWIVNGGNKQKLQYMLGHSSSAMTDRYIRLFCDDFLNDFEEFNPLDTLLKDKKRSLIERKRA